jgi:hypothetical protein
VFGGRWRCIPERWSYGPCTYGLHHWWTYHAKKKKFKSSSSLIADKPFLSRRQGSVSPKLLESWISRHLRAR